MRHEYASWTTLGALVCLVAVVVFAGGEIVDLGSKIDAALRQRSMTQEPQTYETTVTNQQGDEVKITTPREKEDDGTYEPVATWYARHKEGVEYAKAN